MSPAREVVIASVTKQPKLLIFILRTFEKGISVHEYYQLMERKKIFTYSYHKNLIAKLFQSNVLY
ncbi:MAG: hypothetical protein L6290_10585 [Thermodesulfovibrionales bacterium]|nr:hypothetical protein [Thermodesulfovibrionales bacterium]